MLSQVGADRPATSTRPASAPSTTQHRQQLHTNPSPLVVVVLPARLGTVGVRSRALNASYRLLFSVRPAMSSDLRYPSGHIGDADPPAGVERIHKQGVARLARRPKTTGFESHLAVHRVHRQLPGPQLVHARKPRVVEFLRARMKNEVIF